MTSSRVLVVIAVVAIAGYVNAGDVLPAPKRPYGERLVERSITAISIAQAVSVERYGAEVVEAQKPLIAERRGDVWVVKGVLPNGIPGGTLEVWVSAVDGRITQIQHEQ